MKTSEILGKLPVAITAVLVSAIFVLLRFAQTLPTVMQDEYVYMTQIHLRPVSGNEFGNFLHSAVYSLAFYFENFYLATKMLNVVFLILFALAVLFLARRFLESWVATLLTVGTVLSASSLYASVLMPEMMFFAFASWSLAFFVFALGPNSRNQFVFLGLSIFSLALAGVTKPHAIILMLGFVLAIVALLLTKRLKFRKALSAVLCTIVGYLGFKMLLGLLLAGSNGLTIIGANYERSLTNFIGQLFVFNEGAMSASSGSINPVDAIGISTFILFTIFHSGLLILAFMFMTLGLPLFLLRKPGDLSDLQLVVIVVSVVYLIAISAFTGLVTFSGDDHSNRLLGRYFEFLAPFVLIAVFTELAKMHPLTAERKSLLGIGLALLATGWLALLPNTDFKLSDSGTLFGAYGEQLIPWMVVAVTGLVIIIAVDRPKRLMTFVSIAVISTVSIIGLSAQQQQIELNSGKVAADFAGEDLRENFAEIPGDQVVVLGTNQQLAFVTKFWSLKSDVDHFLLTPDATVSINDEVLEKYSLVVELPQISVLDGTELSGGDGYRILGKPAGP